MTTSANFYGMPPSKCNTATDNEGRPLEVLYNTDDVCVLPLTSNRFSPDTQPCQKWLADDESIRPRSERKDYKICSPICRNPTLPSPSGRTPKPSPSGRTPKPSYLPKNNVYATTDSDHDGIPDYGLYSMESI